MHTISLRKSIGLKHGIMKYPKHFFGQGNRKFVMISLSSLVPLILLLALFLTIILCNCFQYDKMKHREYIVVVSTPILHPISCKHLNTSQFDTIYKSEFWGPKLSKPEAFYGNAQFPPPSRSSSSGGGSDLGPRTMNSLDILRKTIVRYNISTMIDIPCGDLNWIFDSWETDSLKLYIGLDVVKPVIDLNSKRFAHHNNKVFAHWDGSYCTLPKFFKPSMGGIQNLPETKQSIQHKSVDLIHSRDVLQHLTLREGLSFLCNMIMSGARVLISTTFPHGSNRNIQPGQFYYNNLDLPPFSLPKNENECVETHPQLEPDQTCVYDLSGDWVKPWIQEKCNDTLFD
jgi:hypothetical protein